MSGGGAVARAGIGFGTALAIAISWSANKSLLWAVIHGLLSWIYVAYYALVYHFK
ncbi:hypothetical protein [Pseudoxanthomonas putridarboris]|uniref:Uncharacterized protein n=1 Tax=Pseudoxanthomonas putridarboris TaxID=752605 RepID=A0ABU9IWZ4_9GAMM